VHGYIASTSGETTGFLASGSGEKPHVAPRAILSVAVAISMLFHVKNKPLLEIV